ncbi:hypothetical protein [Streptomyces sp. NPDC006463]|uniref:hypothetical protein n=1 Tax=Streptomyces sp. NPDC006463 TaxID=3364746 RepID=UPI0036CDAB68
MLAQAAEALPPAGSFDFDLDWAEHGEEVCLASGTPLRAVAGDDTGGTYFLCADGLRCTRAPRAKRASLIGTSMVEALEILFGLPGRHDYTDLDLDADDDVLEEVFTRSEREIRSSYGPELDADRSTLFSGLGLRRLPKRELLRKLQECLLRTESEFLLNADEGCAYALLDRLRRPPLCQAVLAPGGPIWPGCGRTATAGTRLRTTWYSGSLSWAQPSTTGSRGTCGFCAYSCNRRSGAAPPKSSASPRSWLLCTA